MREGFKIEDIHLENEICSNLEYFQVVVLVLGTCDGVDKSKVAGNEPEIRLTETAKKMQRALRKFTEILNHVPSYVYFTPRLQNVVISVIAPRRCFDKRGVIKRCSS